MVFTKWIGTEKYVAQPLQRYTILPLRLRCRITDLVVLHRGHRYFFYSYTPYITTLSPYYNPNLTLQLTPLGQCRQASWEVDQWPQEGSRLTVPGAAKCTGTFDAIGSVVTIGRKVPSPPTEHGTEFRAYLFST